MSQCEVCGCGCELGCAEGGRLRRVPKVVPRWALRVVHRVGAIFASLAAHRAAEG